MRRVIHCRFFLLLAALCLAGCGDERPLTVAVQPWIGYESLCLAQHFGWLPPQVTLRHGQSAADSLAALQAGTAEAAALTLDEVLRARAADVPVSVILILDSSAGADALLARPDITRLADLAGKRVGYEPTAVGALVLSEILTRAGLAQDAIQRVELPIPQQLAAWRSGAVDAVVSYEPTAALLEAQGATRLFDSRQMPDTIFDVLAVRRDRMDGRSALLRRLVEAHFRALAYLRSNREDAVYRIAEHQGMSAADVRRALAGVILPDLTGNRYALRTDSRFEQAAGRLNQLMVQRHLLAAVDPLQNLFDADFLPGTEPAAP
jgi:NitT/TauT family transport system substrate-binding protein